MIGLKENSNRESGVVYVRTTGATSAGETVLEYVRWVMVRKRDAAAPVRRRRSSPSCRAGRSRQLSGRPVPKLDPAGTTSRWPARPRFGITQAGEKIDHVDGMTLEEAEHQIATRLYQNTAQGAFQPHEQAKGRFKRRLVYGGLVICLARALCSTASPTPSTSRRSTAGGTWRRCFAGDTVYAWSEVLEAAEIPGRRDIGALRIMTRASRDLPCTDFPRDPAAGDQPGIILELDYWALLPRRMAA